jgi:hypothetical protein
MGNERDKNVGIGMIIPIAERREGDLVEGLAVVVSNSTEAGEEVIRSFEKDTGATVIKLDSEQSRMERNRFAFSESRWTAPWQPTGHKPNGKTDKIQ